MFKNTFSFKGRIRRKEFGLSVIIIYLLYVIMVSNFKNNNITILLGSAIISWFHLAQSAKRCHDIGRNGWWQLFPLFVFWLLFQDGEVGENEYGENPKGN